MFNLKSLFTAFTMLAAASSARAAFIETLTANASTVVATGSGTLNLAALTSTFNANSSGFLYPSLGIAGVGSASLVPVTPYSGVTGPTNFGSGANNSPISGTGPVVEIAGNAHVVDVPVGYASGTLINDSSTFSGTFASLGITPGTYTWTWGTGATADSFTVQTVSAVPEPTTLAVLGIPAAMGLLRRRRKLA